MLWLIQMSIPHLFRCPISLDLFTDPVTLSTGQTYDRPSIEKWLADGNLTCPVTMQKLQDPSLVPNHTLRHLIDQWLLATSRPKSTKPVTDIIGFSLSALKQNLQSPDCALPTKLETLKKVRLLSVESDIGQACLIQLGFLPLLLQLIFQSQVSSNSELIEAGLDCVLGLSPSTQMDCLNILKDDNYLSSFMLLLERSNVKIKTGLCYLVEMIASSPITQELCLLIGNAQRAMQALVCLLHCRGDCCEAALRAISGLCLLEDNRGNAVGEGAVDGLVSSLSEPTRRNASMGLATLEALAGMETGKRALLKNRAAVGVLVKLVFRVSSSTDSHEGSEHAVASLLVACRESPRARTEAVSAGVVTQLLLLLQSQCGSKAKSKARALLKLLRAMWVEDPGGL